MNGSTHHWSELVVLLRSSSLVSSRRLYRPCPIPLPPESMLNSLYELAEHQGLLPLFKRHLLTSLVLPATSPSHNNQLASILADTFPDYPMDSLLQANWCCVPILTCQQTSGSVVWLLLGRLPGTATVTFHGHPQPAISSSEAASAARSAVQRFVHAAQYEFLGLFLQHPDDPPITGGSLGLPLALGMLLLDRHKQWPPGVFASGGITADGSIQPVTGEECKYEAVVTDLNLLLYPETGLPAAFPEDTRVVRCRTLADAILALDLLAVDTDPQQIAHYRTCLSRPELFLKEFATLPITLLALPEGRRLLTRIQNKRKHLFPELTSCLNACQNAPERAKTIARLLSPDDVALLSQQGDDAAVTALDWCIACIAITNRRGLVTESTGWINLARNIGRQLSTKKKADYTNHLFVTTRFNCYWFAPDPPAEFSRYLQTEEQIYQLDQCDNRRLGAMYGTLAQNYGFCGPQYREEFIDCISKTEQTFGRSYHHQKMRLFAYQIYSLLDCSQLQEATTLLHHYLQLPEKSTPGQWIDRAVTLNNTPTEHTAFQIAVVCRLLVELANTDQLLIQPSRVDQLAALLPAHLIHPWQLIAYNLGRLALITKQQQRATFLFQRSVMACTTAKGTMLPMALLPLAQLSTMNNCKEQALSTCINVLQDIRNNEHFHAQHFAPLITATSPAQALKKVLAEPGRFFPFSYR